MLLLFASRNWVLNDVNSLDAPPSYHNHQWVFGYRPLSESSVGVLKYNGLWFRVGFARSSTAIDISGRRSWVEVKKSEKEVDHSFAPIPARSSLRRFFRPSPTTGCWFAWKNTYVLLTLFDILG